MATWQKVLFSGSAITELQNDSNFDTLANILSLTQSLSSSMSTSRSALTVEVGSLSGSMSTARDVVALQVSGAITPTSSSLSTRITTQEDFSSSLDNIFLTDEELNQGTGSILNDASSSANVITLTKGDATTFDIEVVQSGIDTSTASLALTAPWDGIQNTPAGLASGSTFSSPSQGTATAGFNGVTTNVDLGLQTDDSPTFDGVTTTGDAQIDGNLTVDGTTTTIGSETASIADKFITFSSGSNTAQDGGLVISQQSNGTGQALGYDVSEDLWGFEGNFNPENTGIRADANVNLVTVSGSAPGDTDPAYGGGNSKAGQFWVDTSTNFIWISQPDLIYQDTHYLTGWSDTNYIDFGFTFGGFLTIDSDWSFGFRSAQTLPTNSDQATMFSTGNGALALELNSSSDWNTYAYTNTDAGGAKATDSTPTQTAAGYWLFTYDYNNSRNLKVYYNGAEIADTTLDADALETSTSGNVSFGKSIIAARESWFSNVGASALYVSSRILNSSLNTTAFNNNGDITGDANYDDVQAFYNINSNSIVDLKEYGGVPSVQGSLTFTSK